MSGDVNHRETAPWRALLGLLGPVRGPLGFSIAMRLVHQTLNMAFLVVAVGGVMRMVKDGGTAGMLWPLAGWLLVLGAVKGAARYLEQFSGHYAAFHLLADLRRRLFDQLERLAPAGLGKDRGGDLLSRAMADIERIEVFYAHTLAPIIAAATVPWLAVGALAWMDAGPVAAGLPIGLIAVGAGIPWLARRGAQHAAMDSRRAAADLSAQLTDGLLGLRDVLALRAGDRWVNAIGTTGDRLEASQAGLARWGAFQNAGTTLVIGCTTVAALAAGSMLVAAGKLPPTDLPVVLALVMAAFLPLLGLGSLIPDLELALGSARRIFEILNRPTPETPGKSAESKRRGAIPFREPAHIEFERVSFTYPEGNGTEVLREVSFILQPGEIFAVAGPSGSGKSTIMHLLLRFWTPGGGRILLNGTDSRSFSAEEWRHNFSVAAQRPHIFQTTLRENLLLGKPHASAQEIERALHLASLDDWVAGLPRGLDTPVGALGGRLSGGQRQRLALARAFLRDAPVLLLDEATSHLDARHETATQQAVRTWMTESSTCPKTVLLISHRLSSTRTADRTALLEAGGLLGPDGF